MERTERLARRALEPWLAHVARRPGAPLPLPLAAPGNTLRQRLGAHFVLWRHGKGVSHREAEELWQQVIQERGDGARC